MICTVISAGKLAWLLYISAICKVYLNRLEYELGTFHIEYLKPKRFLACVVHLDLRTGKH